MEMWKLIFIKKKKKKKMCFVILPLPGNEPTKANWAVKHYCNEIMTEIKSLE